MRAPTKPKVDKQHFSNTARGTKAVNLAQKVMRGGIRF